MAGNSEKMLISFENKWLRRIIVWVTMALLSLSGWALDKMNTSINNNTETLQRIDSTLISRGFIDSLLIERNLSLDKRITKLEVKHENP